MLTPALFATLEDAYLAVLGQVTKDYEYENTPRGNPSRECLGVSFQLADPVQRLPYLATRQVNPAFHFAEALWYLGGRTDLDMISYYAPRMRGDSIDGRTINGSAYGSRIFRPAFGNARSSFEQALDMIREEEATKRAVLPIFRPTEVTDLGVSGTDMSCALALHLLVRDGRLHMVCYMRANDAHRGLLADVFSFTLIQEFAARQLGLPIGTYVHHTGSMHINNRDTERVDQVLAEAANTKRRAPAFLFPVMPNTTWDDLAALQEREEALRTNRVQYTPGAIAELGLPPYWQQVLLLFEIKRQLVHDNGPVDAAVLAALDPGFRWLTEHRWPKRMPNGEGER